MPERPLPHGRPSPMLIVLGAGDRLYRGANLAQIAARYPVALLDPQPPAWACELAAAAVAVDLADTRAVHEAARALAERHDVGGVVTYLENHIVLAADVALGLQLPGNPPAAVAACRDKHLTRSILAGAGVPSARSYLVADADTAVEYAALLDAPVVLKPRSLGGSAGVRRADTLAQVRAAFQHAVDARLFGLEDTGTPGVLIEEYLEGPEISVECVVLGHGAVHIAAITRKALSAEPCFLETGHAVDAADPLLADSQIRDTAQAALTAVGLTRGVVHLEMRLTARGPRIIEVNARLGGDLIPRLVHLATGLSLPAIAADLAVGASPDLMPRQNRSAAIRFLYPLVTGRITAVNTGVLAEWVAQMAWTAAPGDHVTALPHATVEDRTALAVVTGPDPDTCYRRLELVAERSCIHIQPDTATTACVA
ncbi:ATP-grasp domain-containing protein [Streptomyces spectabilis]|uniref:ATP-grasp domain-containing protein n=1 Tax=Streptomyces spectabilis TaxID=68270 RepID=UPI0033F2DDBC